MQTSSSSSSRPGPNTQTPARPSRNRPRVATPRAPTPALRNENAAPSPPTQSSSPPASKTAPHTRQSSQSKSDSSDDLIVDHEALKSVRRIVASNIAGPKRMSPTCAAAATNAGNSSPFTSTVLDLSLVSSDALSRASRRTGGDDGGDQEAEPMPAQPMAPGDGFARNRSGKVARNKMMALAGVAAPETPKASKRTRRSSDDDDDDDDDQGQEEPDESKNHQSDEDEEDCRVTRSFRQRRRLNDNSRGDNPPKPTSSSSRLLARAMDAESVPAAASLGKDQADIDRFFEAHATLGITSDNTLAALPTLAHREYLEAVAQLDAEPRSISCDPHVPSRQALMDVHRRCFSQWRFELSQGFNILLVGFGSKHALVTEFVTGLSDAHDVVLVHGYHPLASAKSILNALSSTLQCESTPVGLAEHTSTALDMLSSPTSPYTPSSPLVLAIHSIDSPGLRGEKATAVLSALAAHPSLCLVASADHIHAPLQWDYTTAAKLAFVTHHVATFARYTHETAFENALMVKPGATTPLAVITVLSSLPRNSRACFGVLAREVIAQVKEMSGRQAGQQQPKAVAAAGMPYTQLYARCREQFLVNEETSFRTIMTEFKDHQVITSKRVDGVEVVGVSLPLAGVEKVLEEMEVLG